MVEEREEGDVRGVKGRREVKREREVREDGYKNEQKGERTEEDGAE